MRTDLISTITYLFPVILIGLVLWKSIEIGLFNLFGLINYTNLDKSINPVVNIVLSSIAVGLFFCFVIILLKLRRILSVMLFNTYAAEIFTEKRNYSVGLLSRIFFQLLIISYVILLFSINAIGYLIPVLLICILDPVFYYWIGLLCIYLIFAYYRFIHVISEENEDEYSYPIAILELIIVIGFYAYYTFIVYCIIALVLFLGFEIRFNFFKWYFAIITTLMVLTIRSEDFSKLRKQDEELPPPEIELN